MTVFEGHTVSHLVKDTIMSNNNKVFDITVHLEPAKKP